MQMQSSWHLKCNSLCTNALYDTQIKISSPVFYSQLTVTQPPKSVLYTTTTVLQPFFRHHPGESVPEENFWTLWCKGRLTEADTRTIRLSATPSGLTSAHFHHPPIFYRPDALHAAQLCQSTEYKNQLLQLLLKPPDTPKWPFLWAASIYTCNAFPETTRLGIPNCISTGSAIYAQLTAVNPYTLQHVLKKRD